MDARMTALESSLNEMQYKISQNFVGVDDKIDVVQDRLSGKIAGVGERLDQFTGRSSTLDERLGRIEDLLLFLGRGFGTGEERLARRNSARQMTFPGSDSPESEYSAWIRELRKSP